MSCNEKPKTVTDWKLGTTPRFRLSVQFPLDRIQEGPFLHRGPLDVENLIFELLN